MFTSIRNKFSSKIVKEDEKVEFFSNPIDINSIDSSNKVKFEIKGRIYENVNSIANLIEKSEINDIPDQIKESQLFKKRISLFVSDSERNKRVPVYLIFDPTLTQQQILDYVGDTNEKRRNFEELNRQLTGYSERSGKDGHFIVNFEIEIDFFIQLLNRFNINPNSNLDLNSKFIRPICINEANEIFEGCQTLLTSNGISIISDIDDTIKISRVYDKMILLENTLAKLYEPVPGMAQLYRDWQQIWSIQSQNPVGLHFVSGSPWQMHGSLQRFILSGDKIGDPSVPIEQEESFRFSPTFPIATIHLRLIDWKNIETIIQLFGETGAVKIENLKYLLDIFPNRKFILVGDSGEQDPEIYAKISRNYPAQIKYVFIRDIQVAYNIEIEKDEQKRMQKLFENCPTVTWRLFTNPEELRNVVTGFL
eukprot:TRINITY_DN2919_c0_g1_i2.p1 TRINITY_DN2919_c0_g1~~TRINITY_DN2919_c0_g1_i2.p1  ORF type:complete len:443 (+),score=185.99 TRINITY_DN2919_c0_g1_i2:64-1329(+)